MPRRARKRMVMKRILTFILCIVILLCLSGCNTEHMPQDGSWYCEELQMQISFNGGECFAVIEGEKIPCDCISDRGSNGFFVISQAFNIQELPVGTELFSAERVELTDDTFIVKEEKTGTEYTFIKVVEIQSST